MLPGHRDIEHRDDAGVPQLGERAGFAKGYALGRVSISTKHALALTNRGGATTRELLDLARAIRASPIPAIRLNPYSQATNARHTDWAGDVR